ncbi:unnamed protein product, partial [marine sediment metagenome]
GIYNPSLLLMRVKSKSKLKTILLYFINIHV